MLLFVRASGCVLIVFKKIASQISHNFVWALKKEVKKGGEVKREGSAAADRCGVLHKDTDAFRGNNFLICINNYCLFLNDDV